MTTTDDPVIVDVTGGSAGITASYLAARQLADAFDTAGDRLRDWGSSGLRVMRDPDLVESGLLSPATCAQAEAALLAATGGPQGVVAASLGWEADAVAVRLSIDGLETADEGVRLAIDGLDHGLAAIALNPVVVLAIVLDPDILSRWPGLVDHLVNGLGGPGSAALLAQLYGTSGSTAVAPYTAQLGTTRPGSVRDLIEHLHEVADLSTGPDSPGNGTIEIQTITLPDGTVRHVLYLPGTDDFNAPWESDSDVRDLESDLDAMTGQADAYQQGILDALHQAGVRPDEPMMVVGHSLGGMEAAGMLATDHGYHVTDVVTAGAPTAQLDGYPEGSHVLSLEQEGDIVPQLDGAPNPDSVAQTAVTGSSGWASKVTVVCSTESGLGAPSSWGTTSPCCSSERTCEPSG